MSRARNWPLALALVYVACGAIALAGLLGGGLWAVASAMFCASVFFTLALLEVL